MPNTYCEVLRISVPSLGLLKDHREASTYSLLIVALLERGSPMTLPEVARRFEEVGVQRADRALLSLKRCRPARAPVYRTGDRYELDVHDDELDLWLFRLDFRGPQIPRLSVVPPPRPRPRPDTALTVVELKELFRDGDRHDFSDQRLALAVLDAHGGAMPAVDVVREVHRLTSRVRFGLDVVKRWRSGAIHVTSDGRWTMNAEHEAGLSARNAVRDRLETIRSRDERLGYRPPHEVVQRRQAQEQLEKILRLEALRRVLLVTFPPEAPEALALVDVATLALTTFVQGEIPKVADALSSYNFFGGLGVHGALRALGLDPAGRHVAELGPPQRGCALKQRGRILTVTASLLVQGSCGISKPFRDPREMRRHLDEGQDARVRRALEADAKSLFALYSYGRLHGAYRLRWGFVDEMLPVPWVRRAEPTLRSLLRRASDGNEVLEVVVGRAPAWNDPWTRAVPCRAVQGPNGWEYFLVDLDGREVDLRDVQRARVSGTSEI